MIKCMPDVTPRLMNRCNDSLSSGCNTFEGFNNDKSGLGIKARGSGKPRVCQQQWKSLQPVPSPRFINDEHTWVVEHCQSK
jgi:hypothetical protein